MANYALLDKNNIVTEVIAGNDESNYDWEQHYGFAFGQLCKRTSYNTQENVHAKSKTPFRKNYAGIGYSYDATKDAFIPPKPPYASWALDEDTGTYKAPTTMPDDGKNYNWNEDTKAWDEYIHSS